MSVTVSEPPTGLEATASAGALGGALGGALARTVQESRIIEGALRCFARWGVAKTTVDDIAREAGVSRATVYRAFPDGRDSILEGVAEAQRAAFFEDLGRILGEAPSLEDLLLRGMTAAWTTLVTDNVLEFLLDHEPEIVLRHLAFEGLERLIALCRELLVPFVARWLPPVEAGRLAEWAARVVVSYAIAPPTWMEPPRGGALPPAEWASQLAETVVNQFFLPVVHAWTSPPPGTPPLTGSRGDPSVAEVSLHPSLPEVSLHPSLPEVSLHPSLPEVSLHHRPGLSEAPSLTTSRPTSTP